MKDLTIVVFALLTLSLSIPVSACGFSDPRGSPIDLPNGVPDSCFLPDAKDSKASCSLLDGGVATVSWQGSSMIRVRYSDGTVTVDRIQIYRGCGATRTGEPGQLEIP